jgi:2-polyprenyl-6-methoxyphenol hydroxylase-like FAD-dependent oxidoreductase
VARVECCVVGGGPAGAMLTLLLARQGVRVTLLEQHHDFDRDFRGDTLHPSVLEILDQIGLAQRVLALPHGEIRQASFQAGSTQVTIGDFGHLHTRYPYIAMLPQAEFLPVVVEEARRYPHCAVVMGAAVRGLIERHGVVEGVRYTVDGQSRALRADLTVAADGRFSVVRRLAGLQAVPFAQAIDVLWFRVPRGPNSPPLALGRVGQGHIAVTLPRHDAWQVAWVLPKGGYQRVHAAGLEALRAEVAAVIPELKDALPGALPDWHAVSLLSVEASRVRRWYRPGLLLIGDAAHVMSPVGGVGINYAIQDAVVAANVLARRLRQGRRLPGRGIGTAPLVWVQLQREIPTRFIQTLQNLVQKRLLTSVSQSRFAVLPGWLLRTPVLRDVPVRIVGFGLCPPHVADSPTAGVADGGSPRRDRP